MAENTESGKIVLLLDNYSLKSQLLHESLQRTDENILAVVITEDNFLPENVLSIYDLMIGNYRNNTIRKEGKPKFFNEIPAPDTWSFGAGVQVGDEKSGTITYQQVEKGKIHYVDSPKKWLVRDVEWHDRAGVTRFCDHYNRYGEVCARTVFTTEGDAASKSWFSPEGKEIIVENYITQDIILNDENRMKLFYSKEKLMLYFLKKFGFGQCRIFINSLSISFLLACSLADSDKDNILFWQEIAEDDIPWNMKLIINEETGCRYRIMAQTRTAYDRLVELGMPIGKVQRLGFLYSYEKENSHKPEALICTNSDRIEHCEELIQRLPQMHFHIAAVTGMSPLLFALKKYDNVSLYPGAEQSVLMELFAKCDYYFDINHYEEIVSAVFRAFMNNQLIFAFEETAHNREYVACEHIYPADEFERMLADAQAVMVNENTMKEHLGRQHEWALAETRESYKDMLDI